MAIMGWLITANLLAIISLASAVACPSSQVTAQRTYNGSCASIGYDKTCCPPWEDCYARDGNCHCGAACRAQPNNMCCADNACPKYATTCQEIGIPGCCNSSEFKDENMCRAYLHVDRHGTEGARCSCDSFSCGSGSPENKCCANITSVCPKNCTGAGYGTHICIWSKSTPCYIKGGDCYCDAHCSMHGDCCPDANTQKLITRGDYWVNRLLQSFPNIYKQDSKEYEKFKEFLKSIALKAEILNSYAQYAYALDARFKRARLQKTKSFITEQQQGFDRLYKS